MHPRVYQEFERICTERNAGGAVLEVGALPSSDSLLCMKSLRTATERIGISLDGPYDCGGFTILRGNANCMEFEDDRFDTVLCNSVLEHDKFFWKTISEMQRVTKPGGLIFIGTPGYARYGVEKTKSAILSAMQSMPVVWRLPVRKHLGCLLTVTVTYEVHDCPGDYYRFSRQAFGEVFFRNMQDVKVYSIMVPPRIIGSGIKPQTDTS